MSIRGNSTYMIGKSLSIFILGFASLASTPYVHAASAMQDAQSTRNETADEAETPASAKATADTGKDFIPGTRVIFEDDLSREDLGMFPRSLRLKSGNAEIASVKGKRFIRATSDSGGFEIPLPEVLPQRFTLEFDYAASGNWNDQIYFADMSGNDVYFLDFSPSGGGVVGPDNYRVVADTEGTKPNVPLRVQVMSDGDYVKMYMNGVRVANAPNAAIGRSRKIRFQFTAAADSPALFGNFRVAAGGKDLYKALNDRGRVTAEGIFFDTNSDRIRPESTPVLEEIGEMLTAHRDMRLMIEGHTDNVGSDAANLTLSQKRADAVKRYLSTEFNVDAQRLEANGFGSSKPVADNGTPEGKQKNRRVELVKP